MSDPYAAACRQTYAVYYAGNTEPGDQGFLATSEDLIHWTNYPDNPVLPLPLKECGDYPHSKCWDGEHRRPRSVFQYKDYWYMIYEGTTHHPDMLGGCCASAVRSMVINRLSVLV